MSGRVGRADGVVHEVVDGRAVLVDPSGMQLITLNEVGSLVWEALAEPGDARSLTDALRGRFADVDESRIEADVSAFLDELRSAGLVVDRA